MINKFLQFLKKQQLAINLAKHDCLFVTASLKSFDSVRPLASLFCKKSRLSPLVRIQHFLDSQHDPILVAAYEEITSRTDIVLPADYMMPAPRKVYDGDVLFRKAASLKSKEFYTRLFREIVREDFPELAEQYRIFERRLDILCDMRFYGSEMEHICEEACASENYCPFEIDWHTTSKEKLYLCFDDKCTFSKTLEKEAQIRFCRLFGYLVFERSMFVSYWNGIGVNEHQQVCFLNFDSTYPAYPSVKKFAVDYLAQRRQPLRPEEYKMARALKLLQKFCPEVDISKEWANYLGQDDFGPTIQDNQEQDFLKQLAEGGMSLGQYQPIMMNNPEDLSYMLRPKDLKKEAQFGKSSIVYWGPLAIIFYAILYYF